MDAPCSGEGMFRKDPAAIAEWSPESPEKCARRQAAILDSASECVRGGGRLVYSTCTFNRAENENTVSAFLERHKNFEAYDFELNGVGRSANGCLRLWPHRIRGEGHFVCRLKNTAPPEDGAFAIVKQDKAALSLAKELIGTCVNRLPEGAYVLSGDELFCRPKLGADMSELNLISPGVSLARIKGRLLEPSHALAMALRPEDAVRSVELDAEQAVKYMQGEELSAQTETGWTLVCYKQMPLGWGKASAGALKNHLPKGLRQRGGHSLRPDA